MKVSSEAVYKELSILSKLNGLGIFFGGMKSGVTCSVLYEYSVFGELLFWSTALKNSELEDFVGVKGVNENSRFWNFPVMLLGVA